MKLLLADYQKFVSRKRCGDYDAATILIDIHKAIELANLTDRQRQAIELVYFGELTQAEAGVRMGVGQDTISRHIDAANSTSLRIFTITGRAMAKATRLGGRING